ncbi:glycosyltransferase [Isosphaeraceae bacterium EP7]
MPQATTISAAPRLSVIIAAVNGWDLLGPTLEALDGQPERASIEIIVVAKFADQVREPLAAGPWPVRLIEGTAGATIPALRHQGVVASRADVVAILEDHVRVGPDWAGGMLDAHASGAWGAVGGAVENGREGLVNWAAFLCEYAKYMGPRADEATDDLPGNNISYQRSHLLRHAHLLAEGKWESWINDQLRADGIPLRGSSRAEVRHIKPFKLAHFLVQRFHFCRSYAGMRRPDQSWARRLIYGAGSTALPALLTLRLVRTVLEKGRHRLKLAAALPLIAVFFAVGATGEMLGYLIGPGRSLELVE